MTVLLKNKTFQIIFILYSAGLIFWGRQLDVGLPNFDDAYYAQKAKEMTASGELWVVTHNGVRDDANPPFPFWVTALAFKVFGVSGYAAVFFSALFGVLTVYLTYCLCFHLFRDNWTAFFSAFVLIFPGMFVDSARRGMVDIPLAFCVTGAMFFFIKGLENRRLYPGFGAMTALGILTKSVLGIFPLLIAFFTLVLGRRWKELFSGYFLLGSAIALLGGFSWHLVNWFTFGNSFLQTHFGTLILDRGFQGQADPFYFLGYARDFLKNYWPWLPIALAGVFKFGKQAFSARDIRYLAVFLWIVLVFLIMSTSKNQTLRYLFMIFPALAIVTAKSVADWLKEATKEKMLPYMVGIVMATALFVNATPVQVKVTLSPNSVEVRQLAAIVNLNTPPEQKLGNYRLSMHNPRQALLFYSDRFLDDPVNGPLELLRRLQSHPRSTWLTSIEAFNDLQRNYSERLYLIQANRKYAYFTSRENADNISYDFSSRKLPLIR